MARCSTPPVSVASHSHFRLVKAKLLKVRNVATASCYNRVVCLNDVGSVFHSHAGKYGCIYCVNSDVQS